VRTLEGRRVLLVVTGGIAAYKSAILVRRLREAGAEIDVIMTPGACRFVGPVTFEALSGRAVHRDLWERPLAHLELGREADVVVVAPATADFLARMAVGRANDLASATLLAAPAPIVVCPAMNSRMWEHPATGAHMDTLVSRGVLVVGPDSGELAEGEVGPGRMAEPEIIVEEVARSLRVGSPLAGRRVVVTAGPTRAALDPVRFLSNGSTGRMGFALAAAAWGRGSEVSLIAGPTTLPPPHGPDVHRVRDVKEMLEALRAELEAASVLIMAAAISDYLPERVSDAKLRKEDGPLDLRLVPGPDLLRETRELRARAGILSLGFALETGDGEARARAKLEAKGLDFVALNRADVEGEGMEAETNRVVLIDRWGGREELPLLAKREVAERLLDRLEEHLSGSDA